MHFILRYWIALAAGIVSCVSLFLMRFFVSGAAFVIIAAGWYLLLWLLYRLSARRHGDATPMLFLVMATAISGTILFLLAEWRPLLFLLPVSSGIVIGFLLYQHASGERWSLVFMRKPIRRFNMMLSVFDAYAVFAACFAAGLFFDQIPFIVLAIIGGLAASFFSFFIWRLYYDLPLSAFAMWMCLVFLIVAELMWIMRLFPFGYFVLGFLTAWIWYTIQLFLRFHLSPHGILWQKQRRFLAVNAGLFVVVLFVIRWI